MSSKGHCVQRLGLQLSEVGHQGPALKVVSASGSTLSLLLPDLPRCEDLPSAPPKAHAVLSVLKQKYVTKDGP